MDESKQYNHMPPVTYPIASNWIPRTHTLNPFVLPAGVLSAPQRLQVQLDATAWFILTHLRGFSALAGGGAGNWYTQLFRNRSYAFSSLPMHNRALWGNQLFPYRLGFPIVIPPSGVFEAVCQNLSAAVNTLNLAFHGIAVYGSEEEVMATVARLTDNTIAPFPLEFYAYVLRGTFTPGQAAPLTEVVTGDFDFIATEINGNSTAAFQARMSVEGIQRGNFDDNFVLDQNFLGAATNPNYIHPRGIGKANVMRADVQNLLAVPPNNLIEIDVAGLRFPGLKK